MKCCQTNVQPLPNMPPKRALLELGFGPSEFLEDQLTVESAKHIYSQEYRQLTAGFYLWALL